jgi:septum site-determining protein MinC
MEEISVRGIKGGVLISLPEKPWYIQRDMLISRIQTQERFFKGGRIALDVSGSDWSQDQLFKLLRDLSDEGVCLWAVLTTSETTLASARNFELQTSISSQTAAEKPENLQSTGDVTSVEWHTKPLEKGEKVAFKANGVVIGDVPEGAEVIAAGNLIVWGMVRGSIKAGCGGGALSQILVLRYAGTGLSLCGQLVEVPKKMLKASPLEIRYDEGAIQVKEAVARKLTLL